MPPDIPPMPPIPDIPILGIPLIPQVHVVIWGRSLTIPLILIYSFAEVCLDERRLDLLLSRMRPAL